MAFARFERTPNRTSRMSSGSCPPWGGDWERERGRSLSKSVRIGCAGRLISRSLLEFCTYRQIEQSLGVCCRARARKGEGESTGMVRVFKTYWFLQSTLYIQPSLAHIFNTTKPIYPTQVQARSFRPKRSSTHEATEAGSASGWRHGKRQPARGRHSGAGGATGSPESVGAAMGAQRKPL